jgi:hypothetical protein
LIISELPYATLITAGNQRLVMITDADAVMESVGREVLAQTYRQRIREAIASYRLDRKPEALIRSALYIAAASFAIAVFFWLGRRARHRLDTVMERRLHARLEGLESQSYQIVRAKHLWGVLQGASRAIWLATFVLAGFLYLDFALSMLPWTHMIGVYLFDLSRTPAWLAWDWSETCTWSFWWSCSL